MDQKSKSRDYAEYAEICRAAACTLRMATNVILNAPANGLSSFRSKKEFTLFVNRVESIQKDLFVHFKKYDECARSAYSQEKQSSTAAPSPVDVGSAVKS